MLTGKNKLRLDRTLFKGRKKVKILYIGGTGRLSKDTVALSIDAGHEVTLLNRGSKNRELFLPKNCEIVQGDIRKPNQVRELLDSRHFDVIVDYLSFNPEQLKDNLSFLKQITDQYIFISSATIYCKRDGEEISEQNTLRGNKEWDYAYKKYLCEETLMDLYTDGKGAYTIVRPYVTYGNTRVPYPLVPLNSLHEWTLVDRILRGGSIPQFEGGELPTTLTHTRDFAKAMVGLFGNPKAMNEDFHITNDNHISWNDSLDILEKKLGMEVRRAPMSQEFIYSELPEYKGVLLGDKGSSWIFDNTKIKKAVPNFECTVTLADGIDEMVDFYNANPSLQVLDHSWNGKMDRLCEKQGIASEVDYSDLTSQQMSDYKLGKSAIKSAFKKLGSSVKAKLKR